MRLCDRPRWIALFVLLALPGCNCGDEVPPPVINSFTATPDSLGVDGGMVTLSWSVTGAKTLTLNPSAASLTPTRTGTSKRETGVVAVVAFAWPALRKLAPLHELKPLELLTADEE